MRKLIVILALTSAAYAQKDPVSRSWNQPVEPFRIHGNIYYVGANEITSYLIATPKGHILVDGGFEETAPIILANIRKLGFEPRDVKYLLSSHAHLDHAGGLAELKRVTGATFLSSLGDLPLHARGGLDDPQFANRLPYPPVEADGIVRDRQRITLGGTTLTAHITAGHTRGCTTWTMKSGGKDAVFLCSPTIPSNYRIVGNPLYPEAADDYRRQFERLESLPCDIFLGSHGNFFNLEEKRTKGTGFVDPAGCRDFVARMKAAFEKKLVE